MTAPAAISRRAASSSDREFLRRLFISTREQELTLLASASAGAGASAAAIRALFAEQQFNAQSEAYQRAFPQADHQIIEIDALPAGRLYVHRTPGVLHLVDISLLPEYRGRGIGTALLQGLLHEAAQTGSLVRLSVAASNPAQRLYARLGFKTVDSDGVYLFQTA